MSFWYAHWNKRGMTIFCFKYCTLMVWHSIGTFYARCSRKIWSISLVLVSEWVIISLFINYFWELCDLCLWSQSTCCQTPHVVTESRDRLWKKLLYGSLLFTSNEYCLFFLVFWLVKHYYNVWLSNTNLRSAFLLLPLLSHIEIF